MQSTMQSMMRAVVQDRYGGAEVLRLADVARPALRDDEVLVAVRAAGVDRGTWHVMTGLPYLVRFAYGLRRPRNPIPGLDVAGTVVAVGAEVTRFASGDEVYGTARGSFAEYAAAREHKLARKPAALTFAQAAVVPVSGLTALQALRDAGRVEAGQHVLVLGASGGVGTYAVQLARALGAEVTGVCRTAKVDYVRSIGADHVVDYTRSAVGDGARRYDVILDIAGGNRLSQLRRLLTPRGTLVVVGSEEGGRAGGVVGRLLGAFLLNLVVRQRVIGLASKEHHADLEVLSQFVADGRLEPVVDRTYPLADAADALRRLEAGEVRGKLAVAP